MYKINLKNKAEKGLIKIEKDKQGKHTCPQKSKVLVTNGEGFAIVKD